MSRTITGALGITVAVLLFIGIAVTVVRADDEVAADVPVTTTEVASDTVVTDETSAPAAPTPEATDSTSSDTGVVDTPPVEVTTEESAPATETSDTPVSDESSSEPVANPELTTDKDDYHPGETVTIIGRFFAPVKNFVLKIFGSSTFNGASEDEVSVTSDENGSFASSFTLEDIFRPDYVVKAYDAVGAMVAQIAFTDAANASVNIEQCANGPVAGPFNICKKLSGSDGYVTGNVNSSKAHYNEGQFLPYRGMVVSPNPGPQQVTFGFDTAKKSETKHAIDYLGSYNMTETNEPANATNANQNDPVTDVIPGKSASLPDTTFLIPIPNTLTTSYPAACGINGTFSGTPIQGSLSAWVSAGTVTITGITVTAPDSAATDCQSKMIINYTLDTAGATVVFAWGGHVAANNDTGSGYWGPNSAVPTGSPYHMRVDGNQYSGALLPPAGNCGAAGGPKKNECEFNAGNQELQLASAAIVQPSTITIHKVTTPNASDPTSFAFNTSGTGYTGFNLKGGEQNQQSVTPGSYSVAETVPTNWSNTDLTCTASGQGTSATKNLANHSVAITIGANGGGTVDCVYTNNLNKVVPTVATQVHNGSHADITNSSVALGTATHDKIIVTGNNPGGTADFVLYNGLTCSGSIVSTQNDVALSDGVGESTAGALPAGQYSYKVHYDGDTNNEAADAACEPFTVNKAQLSVTTNVHDADHNDITSGHVALGSVLHDTATVSGGVSGFTVPTPTFTLTSGYTDTCAAGATVANNGTDGGKAKSADSPALAAGSYAYRAVVAGNANYEGATGDCEPVTVDKAQLSVTTYVHNASHVDKTNGNVPLGSILHDTAVLGGVVAGFDAPTPAFTLTSSYTDSCAAGTSVVNNGTEGNGVKSADSAALGAGKYAYRATVAGNDNYLGATGDCEPVTVDKAQLSVTTNVHDATHAEVTNGHVALGSVLHDTATVSGGVTGFTVPTPTFTLTSGYTNSCSAGVDVLNDGTDGSAAKSADSAALGAGKYAYRAVVDADANYLGTTGDCEPVTVDKAQLAITTTLHDAGHVVVDNNGHVALGTVMHDNANVTGGVDGFAIPAISFNFDSSAIANAASTEATFDATSIGTSALGAGNHKFTATVAGNDNYLGATSADEPFTVDKAQLAITTTLHKADHTVIADNGHVALGTVMHDNADVTGEVAGFPIGAVSFTFDTDAIANNATTDGSFDATSVDTSSLAAGDHTFNASVADNDNYLGATSADEPFTVDKAQLAITTTLHKADHSVVANDGHVALGTKMHDNADVTGGVIGFDLPAVSFAFDAGAIANAASAESGFDATSIESDALAAGNHKFSATVADNDNYLGATSADEPFTVDKAQLSVSTLVHNASDVDVTNGHVALGSVLHDTATVSGAVSGFDVETPAFTLTSGYTGTCAAGTSVANNGTEGSATRSADSTALGAGAYAYRATVAGNDNYEGATGDCEPVTVDKAQLSVSTEVHDVSHADLTNGQVEPSSVMHDTATVSGGVTGFTVPTPTFTLTSGYTNSCAAGASVANNGMEGSDFASAASAALTSGKYAYRAAVGGDANYLGATGTCEPFTVIRPHTTVSITSNTQETTATENVILTISDKNDGDVPLTNDTVALGYGGSTTTLDKDTAGMTGDNGDGIMQPGETWTWMVTVLISADTTFTVVGDGVDPLGNHVNPTTGFASETANTTVKVVSTTRTLGFWQTHTAFTTHIFNDIWTSGKFIGQNIVMGGNTHKGQLTNVNQVFGGFYAPIAKTSTGGKRNPADQARITLLQQLLAAKLNCAAFSCSPATQANITAADAAYAGGDKNAIMNYVSILDAYNNSGDNGAISSVLGPTGKATPKTSQSIADTAFWNMP